MKAKLSPGTIGQIQMKIEALEQIIEANRKSDSYDRQRNASWLRSLEKLKAKINS